jgi:tRNA(Arg) A34 adenosine deaminase TadA
VNRDGGTRGAQRASGDTGASSAWASLSRPWQAAFEEAWHSWRGGNFGIGAVLVDPATGAIVSAGRNRVAETTASMRTLNGNMTAHAEMNAFAGLDRFNADGLHLYTTLEPCLMCAATAMLLKVAHVHFAAFDEFFDGMHELWTLHPITASRVPERTGPLRGDVARLAHFARLLPIVFTLEHLPDRTAAQLARSHHPELAALATSIVDDPSVAAVRATGTVVDGLTLLWDRLPTQ